MTTDRATAYRTNPSDGEVCACGHAVAEHWLCDCDRRPVPLPLHRTEAGYPRCATCDGGGCPDCTDPS